MLLACLLLILGFIIIVYAADMFVDSAAFIAFQNNVSPLLIGLTLVAFGTSAPEIVVSIMAAIDNKSGLAIGNAIGSNIANIGLVLGLTLLIKPIQYHLPTITREFIILVMIMCLTFLLIVDGYFGLFDGIILLISLCALLTYLALYTQKKAKQEVFDNIAQEEQEIVNYPWMKIVAGLVLLPLSAHLIVRSATVIAAYWGVSETVIGLTIVAFGTSLPEVATSIAGIIKGKDDIAIGNILGSNMFNLLAVLPFVGLINPTDIPQIVINRDILTMFIITLVLMAILFIRKKVMGRLDGVLLMGLYLAYFVILFTHHS